MTAHVLESMNEVITNNYDSDHKAIDIVASDKKETNIIALDGGKVNKVVNHVKGTNHQSQGLATYGNYVKVKQNNGKTAKLFNLRCFIQKGGELWRYHRTLLCWWVLSI